MTNELTLKQIKNKFEVFFLVIILGLASCNTPNEKKFILFKDFDKNKLNATISFGDTMIGDTSFRTISFNHYWGYPSKKGYIPFHTFKGIILANNDTVWCKNSLNKFVLFDFKDTTTFSVEYQDNVLGFQNKAYYKKIAYQYSLDGKFYDKNNNDTIYKVIYNNIFADEKLTDMLWAVSKDRGPIMYCNYIRDGKGEWIDFCVGDTSCLKVISNNFSFNIIQRKTGYGTKW